MQSMYGYARASVAYAYVEDVEQCAALICAVHVERQATDEACVLISCTMMLHLQCDRP